MTILKTQDLAKTYGRPPLRVEALKPTSIEIEEGEFVALVGPSGSGKSTLLHLLGGLDAPTSGSVRVSDQDLYEMPESSRAVFRRRHIGFVFQFFNLVPVLTARENIGLPLLLDGRQPDEGYLTELMDLLGIAGRAAHMPSELSGGEQQRVSIGRALISRPAIVLADEPTGNLDRKTGREILDLLRMSADRYRQTIVMITHDLDAAALADRVLAIEDGVVGARERSLV